MRLFHSPPPLRLRRTLRLGWLCLAGCTGAAQSQNTPLREELAALRQSRDADRKRIDALEVQVGTQQIELRRLRADPASQPFSASAPVGLGDGSENLPIVHLQPHSPRDLPAVPTEVAVREPSPEVVAELAKPQLFSDANLSSVPGDSLSASEEADSMFKIAFEKLKTGELVGAAGLFHAFAQRFPHHPAADNAMLDEGIADYGLRRYQDALEVLEQLAKRYPAGDAVAEALWRAGDCQLKLQQPTEARVTYQLLMKRFPGSAEATKAAAQLSAIDNQDSHVAATEGVSP